MLILLLANKGQKKKASSSSETSYTIFVILSPSDQAILCLLLHRIHKGANSSHLQLHFKPDFTIPFFKSQITMQHTIEYEKHEDFQKYICSFKINLTTLCGVQKTLHTWVVIVMDVIETW